MGWKLVHDDTPGAITDAEVLFVTLLLGRLAGQDNNPDRKVGRAWRKLMRPAVEIQKFRTTAPGVAQ